MQVKRSLVGYIFESEKMKILVLGGNGFIGRQIVAQLKTKGAEVLVGSRNADAQEKIMQLRLEEMQGVQDWLPRLADIDVVVNSVGILRERGFKNNRESYEAIHTIAPAILAEACAQLGIRLVHISAIGLSLSAKSQFIRSKYLGEQAILASGANATIVRPSLLDGEGGYGAKWFRRVSTWPVQFVMQSKGVVAPLQVSDLGEAVANLCEMDFDALPRAVELGGNDILTIPEYLKKLRANYKLMPALQLPVPKFVVRVFSHLFDVMAWTPLSFGHFELMQGYNAPAVNMLPTLLGRKPMEVGAEVEVGNALNDTVRVSTI